MKKLIDRKVKYQGVSLPAHLIDIMKDHVLKHEKYTSVTDFVKEAIRIQMEADNQEFMRRWWGEKAFDKIKSGNVPLEKIIHDELGLNLDDKTGEINSVDREKVFERLKELSANTKTHDEIIKRLDENQQLLIELLSTKNNIRDVKVEKKLI